ncbi:MAG: ACP phosphodiesterase [Bacteroidota bacterium]
MNYLAHAYLSFNDPEILVGNLISDFVKGKKKFDYPPVIRQGIMLHRFIDTYTDEHPATKEAKEIFRPHYRLYSGAFVDVVYDHFLARDENEFTEPSLFDFSQQVYSMLENYQPWFPEHFAMMFPLYEKTELALSLQDHAGNGKKYGGCCPQGRLSYRKRYSFLFI